MSSEEEVALAAALRAVEAARGILRDYAGRHSPVRTHQLASLLRGTECHLEIFPFRSDTVAMVLPGLGSTYVGPDPTFVSRQLTRRSVQQ
jgi:hypothetical protein